MQSLEIRRKKNELRLKSRLILYQNIRFEGIKFQ
jgi:hypothetical protein